MAFALKRRLVWVILPAIIGGGLLLFILIRACPPGDTLKLAVIGPMSGKDHDGGQAMLDGVRLYISEVNRQGGVHGKRLDILVYDDQNKKDTARKKALEIAQGTKSLAVIGHYFSSTSIAGGEIFKQYGVPAITASATAPELTHDNDWYFGVAPDTNQQGKLSAIYTKEVLDQNIGYIAFERDAYGCALKRSFEHAARDLGLRIKAVWGIDSKTDDIDAILKTIAQKLQRDQNPGALFLALQDREAAKLVRLIRDWRVNIYIVGGDAIGSETFVGRFKEMGIEPSRTGYYTDGIYAATLFSQDIANRKAQRFINTFKHRYGKNPNDMAAAYYDAAAIAVEAVKQSKLDGDVALSRKTIKNRLRAFSSIETAYKGVTGRIYFDEHGKVIKPFPFGIYLHDELISAPTQISPIVNPEAVIDLREEIENGNILRIDDRFMYKTKVVYTGIDVNEISNIDERNGSFTADIYLWFRHNGPLDYGKIEFLNGIEEIKIGNDPIQEKITDEASYSAYRIKGNFRQMFYFHDYPFDTQTLSIRFRHETLSSERLVFVADNIGMQLGDGNTNYERFLEHSSIEREKGWHLKNVAVFPDVVTTISTLGNPGMFHAVADTNINYSRFNVITEIERDAKSYILNNLIPIFIVIILGYVMLYVNPKGPPFVARMNLGVSALITAVFLGLRADSKLPDTGYLVAVDYIYFATYAYILIGIIACVAELILILRDKDKLAKRLALSARIFQPLFITLSIFIIVVLYT